MGTEDERVARSLPDYDELEIRLTPGRGDAYNVEIASASGARGHGQFVAPAELDVTRFRLTVDPRSRATRGSSRYMKAAQQFGAGLFEALVAAPSVREVYAAARREARAAGRGSRVTLSLRSAPELASIPWEFLYDRPRFLANHVDSPVVRFVDLEDPPSPLAVEPPLRILGMVSRPKDDALAALDSEEEQAALKQRLDPLIEAGRVTLRWLARATLQALQEEVDHGEDFHVFHYIGHGEYDQDSGESSLILEHPDGRAHRVGGQQLGELLCDRGSLRLAVLNACETAQTEQRDPLAGIATSLMEYDVPAVVAMQFAITDEGALVFADEFYRALAGGYPVDAAVTQARRALAAHSDVEWATPVLFMRVADGRLFDLKPTAPASSAGDVDDLAAVPRQSLAAEHEDKRSVGAQRDRASQVEPPNALECTDDVPRAAPLTDHPSTDELHPPAIGVEKAREVADRERAKRAESGDSAVEQGAERKRAEQEAPATRKAAEREAEPAGTLEPGRRVTAARDAHPRHGAASGLVTAQEDRAEVRPADPASGVPHRRSWRVIGLALVVAVGLLTAVLVAVLTSGSSVPSSTTTSPPAPIAWHTPPGLKLPMPLEGSGVAVWNDEVWVAGGCSLPHGPCGPPWVANVWHYGPATTCHGSAWCPGPPLPHNFGLGHPALVSFEHHLYLIGGTGNDSKAVDTVYYLDSPTGHWQSAPRLPFPRAEGAAASDGSRIVFAGGVDRNHQPQADIWVFDGAQWNTLDGLHPTRKRLEHPRSLLAATSDGVGTVWFIGGEFGTTLSRAVDVVRGNDVTHAQLREPVTRSAAVAVGSRPPRYCAIGGDDPPSDKVQCQQGLSLPPLKQPTSGPGAAILGNKVYVVGGFTHSLTGGIRTVEVLDISHVR